jgi:hypothetical protein
MSIIPPKHVSSTRMPKASNGMAVEHRPSAVQHMEAPRASRTLIVDLHVYWDAPHYARSTSSEQPGGTTYDAMGLSHGSPVLTIFVALMLLALCTLLVAQMNLLRRIVDIEIAIDHLQVDTGVLVRKLTSLQEALVGMRPTKEECVASEDEDDVALSPIPIRDHSLDSITSSHEDIQQSATCNEQTAPPVPFGVQLASTPLLREGGRTVTSGERAVHRPAALPWYSFLHAHASPARGLGDPAMVCDNDSSCDSAQRSWSPSTYEPFRESDDERPNIDVTQCSVGHYPDQEKAPATVTRKLRFGPLPERPAQTAERDDRMDPASGSGLVSSPDDLTPAAGGEQSSVPQVRTVERAACASSKGDPFASPEAPTSAVGSIDTDELPRTRPREPGPSSKVSPVDTLQFEDAV